MKRQRVIAARKAKARRRYECDVAKGRINTERFDRKPNECPDCGKPCILAKREVWGLSCACGYWKAAAPT